MTLWSGDAGVKQLNEDCGRVSPKHLFEFFLKWDHSNPTECAPREDSCVHTALRSREVCRAVELNGFWGLRTSTIHLSASSCKHSALISEGLLVPLKNLFSQHRWEKGFHGFNFSISRNLRNWDMELLLSTQVLSMGIVKNYQMR